MFTDGPERLKKDLPVLHLLTHITGRIPEEKDLQQGVQQKIRFSVFFRVVYCT
jgi:hypothetical protein